jgi:ABC-type transport system involved in Fe-S cluster assembly fused permease/ATPase subunit
MNDRDVVGLFIATLRPLVIQVDVQVPRGIHTDCLLNYETIKYFGGEEHEGNRYREAFREYQILEYKMTSNCTTCLFHVPAD